MAVRKDAELVISYLTLRLVIGALAILMPIAVRLGAYWFEGIVTTDSISAYYYTGTREIFTSTLVIAGALLACFRTRFLQDNVVATIAGLAAIGIAIFPMDPHFAPEILEKYPHMIEEGACYINRGILGLHFWFVATFFALAFYLVFFRFSVSTSSQVTAQKAKRNYAYRACGIAMLIGFVAIGYLALFKHGASIFWPEALAVIGFSAAWLVKGQAVLKDR
jgi:hypothetical protein